VVALLAAFSFHFFLATRVVTRVIVGAVGGILACLIIWSVSHAWETQPESNARPHQPMSDDKSMNSIVKFWSSVSTFGGKLGNISMKMTPRINIRKSTMDTGNGNEV